MDSIEDVLEDSADEVTNLDIKMEDILTDPAFEEKDIVSDPSDRENKIVKGPAIGVEIIREKREFIQPPSPKEYDFEIDEKDFKRKEITNEDDETVEKDSKETDEENPLLNYQTDIIDAGTNPNEVVQEIITDPIKDDHLYDIIKKEDSTNNLLTQVMTEIAEELSYLKAYRKVHYLANEDVSEVSVKRVKSLKILVETLIEKEKLKNIASEGKIDFSGKGFEKVMEFILTTVKETFEKVGIPEQFNDIFFIQLAQNLEGFEKKVEKIYYGISKK